MIRKIVDKIVELIIECLSDDIVSYGLLVQCIKCECGDAEDHANYLTHVLKVLLEGEVEIGMAQKTNTNYVEFIAWKGTIADRIERAASRVQCTSDPDREFAYWLCLRRNVNRYEEDADAC